MFTTATHLAFADDERNHRTVLELVAADRPGLLSELGKVFVRERIGLRGARISTVGERAEDVFYITDMTQRPLDATAAEQLRTRLIAALDRRGA